MKDRLTPCIYYERKGQCSKGFEAEQMMNDENEKWYKYSQGCYDND